MTRLDRPLAVALLGTTLLCAGCAEWRGAGREVAATGKDVGHEVKEAAIDVGHEARKAGKKLGRATQEAAHEVRSELEKK